MAVENGVTWRELADGECAFGKVQAKDLNREVERLDKELCGVKTKLDRLTWALAMAAVGFASAAIMLALNLIT